MMLLALLLADAPALGAIGVQSLPTRGCAAYLWSASDRKLVAMSSAEPPRLRLMLDGKRVDLPLGEAQGTAALGLPPHGTYRAGTVAATLDLTIAPRADLRDGAAVPQGLLRIMVAGRDELAVPVGGLVGCATADVTENATK